jgi:hypothetical protein
MRGTVVKWLLRAVLLLVSIYVSMVGLLAYVVTRPPGQFGQIMKRLPMPLVFGVLPGQRLFTWAREGGVSQGDPAPDFTLRTLDRSTAVTLSSFRGQRPVVLVFGSYT